MSFQIKTRMHKKVNTAQEVRILVYYVVEVKLIGNKAHTVCAMCKKTNKKHFFGLSSIDE